MPQTDTKQDTDIISTAHGPLSREKYRALALLRNDVLNAIRNVLRERFGYLEATPSTLVNIAGSCENPHASFKVDYYGRPAYLSQSAQLQLEALVLRLQRGFFTVNNSFREEHFDDLENKGRRLSEFTLIEAEHKSRAEIPPHSFLLDLITEQKELVASIVQNVLAEHQENINRLSQPYPLGGESSQLDYLNRVVQISSGGMSFGHISYDEALIRLNISDLRQKRARDYQFGDDFGTLEERELLQQNEGMPLFVTHHPASLKFFNMKRTPDGKRVYSVDLLMPNFGETIGGAVREEDPEKIKEQLLHSKVGAYMREQGISFPGPFGEYFNTLEEEPATPRGGYGIGFERLIGFLIDSTDILETVAYRTLRP